MLAMKEGSMVWALNKDATLVQKTYGVLLPQLLLLYSSEEDFHVNREKPTKYFNLQRCLAIHPTDKCPGFFGIMLMIVPGGVDLLGCCSETERREWMEELNKAMDTKIVSAELCDFIGTILGRHEVFTDGYWYTDDEFDHLSRSSKSFTPHFNSKSLPSPKVAQTISPISIVPRSNDTAIFSCPPLDLVGSPLLESPVEFSPSDIEEYCPKNCLSEVLEIPDRMYSNQYDSGSKSNTEIETDEFVIQEKRINGYLIESSEKADKSMSEGENIIDQVMSLSKTLISQEAANAILTESCDKIKDTLRVLYDRLRLKGINVESAFHKTVGAPVQKPSIESSSIQDVSCSVSSHDASDTSSVVRRKGHHHRRPGQTVSLIMPRDEENDSCLPAGNSGFLGSAASSIQTLVAPNSRSQPPPNASDPKVCANCLKTAAVAILEVSMNLINSQASISPQTIRQVQTLTAILHSYLVDRIRIIRSRTGLPIDGLITGLSKIAQNDPNSPAIAQALVEKASAEVCEQILEEIDLLDDKREESPTFLVNGLASDWFKSIPEKTDIQWMLPGYIASCLLLNRLSECGSNKAKEFDRSLEATIDSENSSESQFEGVLEALSIALNHDVCQVTGKDRIEDDPNLQLGQAFESMFFELLLSKYDKNAMEVILPEITDNRNMNSDKLLWSKLRRPDEMVTLGELRSSLIRDNENDSSLKKQSSLTPSMNNALDELEDLSTHRLENRRAFYDRVQENHEARDAEEANQEARDYTNVISALKREHEEERLQLLQDVRQNQFPRDYYDAYTIESMSQPKSPYSQFNQLCVRDSDLTSNYSKLQLAKMQEIIRDSHVILLDLVENAIDIFSKFVNGTLDRKEGLDDEEDGSNFNEITARVPEALAGLEAAVNDLRSRLFCDIDGEEDDMVGEGPGHGANSLSSEFDRRLLHPRKTSPSPLGFTITLQETEDPDEVSESEV